MSKLHCIAFLILTVPLLASAQDINNVPAGSPFAEAYRAALIAYKNGNYKEARDEALKAQKLKATDAKIQFLLGRITLELGDQADAEKLVKAGIEADPNYSLGYQYLGDVYFREKQYVPATEAYEEFLRHKPKDPDGALRLLYCHVARKDLAAAGKTLLLLDQFTDLHPGYYFGKAAIAQAAGKGDEAERDLQLARTMYGNDAYATQLKHYLLLFPVPKTAEEKK